MTRHAEISAVINTAGMGTPWERKTPRNRLTYWFQSHKSRSSALSLNPHPSLQHLKHFPLCSVFAFPCAFSLLRDWLVDRRGHPCAGGARDTFLLCACSTREENIFKDSFLGCLETSPSTMPF